MLRIISVTVVALVATSCQIDSSIKMEGVQLYEGDPFEVADGQCRIAALAQQRGLYARRTRDFVAGARLRNAVRTEKSYKQCMNSSGWKLVTR